VQKSIKVLVLNQIVLLDIKNYALILGVHGFYFGEKK
jgi:hypothetical protein